MIFEGAVNAEACDGNWRVDVWCHRSQHGSASAFRLPWLVCKPQAHHVHLRIGLASQPRFIASVCITAQMQMLAFQARVRTRPATTPAPAFQVTKRVPARNTNAIATGRVAACQMPTTMLILRPSAPPSSRRLSCASVILVTAWTPHLTGTKASRRRVELRHVDPWRRLPLPAAAHTDGHLKKQLVPGATGVRLVVLWDSFLLETQGTAEPTTPRRVTSCTVVSMTLRRRYLRQLAQDPGQFDWEGRVRCRPAWAIPQSVPECDLAPTVPLQRGSVLRTTARHLNGLGLRRREWAPRQKCRFSWPTRAQQFNGSILQHRALSVPLPSANCGSSPMLISLTSQTSSTLSTYSFQMCSSTPWRSTRVRNVTPWPARLVEAAFFFFERRGESSGDHEHWVLWSRVSVGQSPSHLMRSTYFQSAQMCAPATDRDRPLSLAQVPEKKLTDTTTRQTPTEREREREKKKKNNLLKEWERKKTTEKEGEKKTYWKRSREKSTEKEGEKKHLLRKKERQFFWFGKLVEKQFLKKGIEKKRPTDKKCPLKKMLEKQKARWKKIEKGNRLKKLSKKKLKKKANWKKSHWKKTLIHWKRRTIEKENEKKNTLTKKIWKKAHVLRNKKAVVKNNEKQFEKNAEKCEKKKLFASQLTKKKRSNEKTTSRLKKNRKPIEEKKKKRTDWKDKTWLFFFEKRTRPIQKRQCRLKRIRPIEQDKVEWKRRLFWKRKITDKNNLLEKQIGFQKLLGKLLKKISEKEYVEEMKSKTSWRKMLVEKNKMPIEHKKPSEQKKT